MRFDQLKENLEILENFIRGFGNLDEQLHHSFNFYFFVTRFTHISSGLYFYSSGFFLVSLIDFRSLHLSEKTLLSLFLGFIILKKPPFIGRSLIFQNNWKLLKAGFSFALAVELANLALLDFVKFTVFVLTILPLILISRPFPKKFKEIPKSLIHFFLLLLFCLFSNEFAYNSKFKFPRSDSLFLPNLSKLNNFQYRTRSLKKLYLESDFSCFICIFTSSPLFS